MSEATTSIRGSVRTAVKAGLVADAVLSGVQVERSWPSKIQAEAVIVGDIKGQMEIDGIKAGRKRRIDVFTVEVWIFAENDGQSDLEAETRAETMFTALENLVANDPTIGGVVGLETAVNAAYDGPDLKALANGYGAVIRAEIACRARLH